ncbi:hypothetical protein [Paenibacillus pinistramenti]|uniref:hypothetical protein n=1 Tax=Paenibacillus pinistramenti TaxID=1768003 RepID=UPI001108DA51|nr:hypothetical protein [Paenibacillus pinistramenti]
MSRHIQAYFRTEDEAESARSHLVGYRMDNLEVGRLEEGIGRDRDILIPIVPIGNTSGMYTGGAMTTGGAAGAYTTQGAVPVVDPNAEESVAERDIREDKPEDNAPGFGAYETLTDGDYDDLNYVLSARVDDQSYDEIVQKLRSEGAYVERLD